MNNDVKFIPTLIKIENAVKDTALVKFILNQLPDVEREYIANAESVWLDAQQDEYYKWQGVLLLAKQRGPFLRACPGTNNYICCGYQNLDTAAGCNLNCSYCILQSYLKTALITIYCNLDDMYTELEKKLLDADRLFRIGTGELSDSLTFDHLNEQSRDLVKFFSTRKNAILELKTKNTTIDHFINVRHNRHTVVSWSLNSEKIARTDEKKSPSVEERIRVADQVQRAGFLLGFHFDPLITHIEWEDEYRLILDRLFLKIKPENIAWISLGALRYPPQLDEIIRQNHPESDIVLGELLPGEDKKYRYFRPIRTGMFQKMYNWIKSKAPDVFVYLCMESDQVWRESFGWSPGSSGKLKKLLDKRVFPQSSC